VPGGGSFQDTIFEGDGSKFHDQGKAYKK